MSLTSWMCQSTSVSVIENSVSNIFNGGAVAKGTSELSRTPRGKVFQIKRPPHSLHALFSACASSRDSSSTSQEALKEAEAWT
eukprot:9477651-Pyramimonas_sp.AAC.1